MKIIFYNRFEEALWTKYAIGKENEKNIHFPGECHAMDSPFLKCTLMDLYTRVKQSSRRALSGAITSHLRGVTFSCNKDMLVVRAYFDDGASDNDKELVNISLSEIMADLWQDVKHCRYEPIGLPEPAEMEELVDWIYKRGD